ncbi:adenylate kinase [Candidatus Woesearchaeota archaeon]|nr:adenylate kinase [Candidatus Woesearchaeota archaeon]
MYDRIILVGVPGSGKTTVANKSLEGTDFKIINFGDHITELLKRDGHIKEVDDIRSNLKQEIWIEYQKKTAEHISKIQGNLLITTHASFMTPIGFFPGLPDWTLQGIKPHVFVIIEARPEEIAQWQAKDTSRKRGMYFERDISLFQEINRIYCVYYSGVTGARVKIIKNEEGRLNEAIQELRNVLLTPKR